MPTEFAIGDRVRVKDDSVADGFVGRIIKWDEGQWTILLDKNKLGARWWECTDDEMKLLKAAPASADAI